MTMHRSTVLLLALALLPLQVADSATINSDRSPGARPAGALANTKHERPIHPASIADLETPIGIPIIPQPSLDMTPEDLLTGLTIGSGVGTRPAQYFGGSVGVLPPVGGGFYGGGGAGGGAHGGSSSPSGGGGSGGSSDGGTSPGGGIIVPPDHGGVATPAPEPATWAMMIVGMMLVGAAMRRRPCFAH